jgi:hypothetical protein
MDLECKRNNGKTKRSKICTKREKFDMITRYVPYSCGFNQKVKLYPITKIEELYGFSPYIKVDYARANGTDIIELLESECTTKNKHFVRNVNDYETIYKMPITKHIKIDQSKECNNNMTMQWLSPDNQNHWFSYKGKTYNG